MHFFVSLALSVKAGEKRVHKKKINKRLFFCEQLLFLSVIGNFKTFRTCPMAQVSQFTTVVTCTKQGLWGIGNIFLKELENPQPRGDRRV